MRAPWPDATAHIAHDHLLPAAAAAEAALRLAGRLLQMAEALVGGAAEQAAAASSGPHARRTLLAFHRLQQACVDVGSGLTNTMLVCMGLQRGAAGQELEAALAALAVSASKLGFGLAAQPRPAQPAARIRMFLQVLANAANLLTATRSRAPNGGAWGSSDRWGAKASRLAQGRLL